MSAIVWVKGTAVCEYKFKRRWRNEMREEKNDEATSGKPIFARE